MEGWLLYPGYIRPIQTPPQQLQRNAFHYVWVGLVFYVSFCFFLTIFCVVVVVATFRQYSYIDYGFILFLGGCQLWRMHWIFSSI